MKKIVLSVLAVLFAASFVACGGGSSQGGIVKGKSYVSEGWVNENTFRVISTGAPKAGLTNPIQQKGTAKEAAIAMAEKRIIEKFVGARLEGAAGVADYASTGVAVSKQFEGTVKGGTIVKETYDEDNNCEIVYQVEKKGLKKEVMGGATATTK